MEAKTLRRTDTFLWIGSKAIYTWDRRSGSTESVEFPGRDTPWVPYVPKFHDVWEDGGRYQEELRTALDVHRFTLWGKRRVLVAVPDDLTQIESVALEDFLYAAMGGALKRRHGVTICSQSEVLLPTEGCFLAVTHSCRCYSVVVVRDGEVVDKTLLDVNDCTRGMLVQQIREYHRSFEDSATEVYYPKVEPDWLMEGVGAGMGLDAIVARFQKTHP